MSEDLTDEDRAIREELGRRAVADGIEEVSHLSFLTVNPEVRDVFEVPVVDTEGKVMLNNGVIVKDIPLAYEPLFKITQLIANHLSRTGNISEKEAELMEMDLQIQLDEVEIQIGRMPVWATALRMYLSMAIKDAIDAHRMKGLLIKRFEAVVESTKSKKKRFGLF